MGNYTTFLMFENPRRGRQARNFTENDPKILDLKSSSEQIIFRKLTLGAPVFIPFRCCFAGSLPFSLSTVKQTKLFHSISELIFTFLARKTL